MVNPDKLFSHDRKAGEGITLSVKDIALSLIWCPAGEFIMGSSPNNSSANSDEKHQRRIRLSNGFWIGRTPVTCELWDIFMGRNLAYPSRTGFPAAGMMWTEGKVFTERLTIALRKQGAIEDGHSFSLPSEAQWDYACKAGTDTIWYFGDDVSLLKDHAWYRENSKDINPVASKLSNPWGLYDLYGNVHEWCLDNIYGYRQQTDATLDPLFQNDAAPTALKVMRGGSYWYVADQCTSSRRHTNNVMNEMLDPMGVRVVLRE